MPTRKNLTRSLLCALFTVLSFLGSDLTKEVRADDPPKAPPTEKTHDPLTDLFGDPGASRPADGTRGKDRQGNAYRWLNGSLFYDQGGYAQQIEDLTAAIKTEPEKAGLYLQRGTAYAQVFFAPLGGSLSHDWADADKDFSKAIELDPKMADAWAERGLNVQVPRLNPSKQSILRGLADGLADLNKAIALQPDHAAFYAGRGSLSLRAIEEERSIIHSDTTPKQIEEAARSAEADFTKALTLDPKTPQAARNRAAARQKLQSDPASIKADLVRAVALDPKDAQAQGMLVDTALALGDWELARTASDAILALRPDFTPAYLARAHARFSLKDSEGALADASQAVKQAGTDKFLLGQALVLRGELYTAQGNHALALADFSQATDADAYNVGAWDGLGQEQFRGGKLEDAVAAYQHGLEKLPQAYVFHLRLALLAALRDDPGTVKKEYAAAQPQVTGEDLHAQAAIVEAALKTRPNSLGLAAVRDALQDAAQKLPGRPNAGGKP